MVSRDAVVQLWRLMDCCCAVCCRLKGADGTTDETLVVLTLRVFHRRRLPARFFTGVGGTEPTTKALCHPPPPLLS